MVRRTDILVPRHPRLSINALAPLRAVWHSRSLRWLALGWLVVHVIVLVLGRGPAAFDRPSLDGTGYIGQLVNSDETMAEVLVLMSIVVGLTRHRIVPDLFARLPARVIAVRETTGVLLYGVIVQAGGIALGRVLGWHGFSFHLAGTLYGTHEMIQPREAIVWSIYNGIVYALVPLLVFRRRYTARQLNLQSTDRRNDTLVIAVILLVEGTLQLLAVSHAIFDLSPHQALLGVPLTFLLYFAGTVMPTMVFIFCILTPRYLALTHSLTTTVVLGGLTYAALHAYESWMAFGSPRDIVLSFCFLLLTYVGPGMFKAFLTLRTGNAWVHVWAYHAIAPHTLVDTPHMVEVFSIR